MKNEIQKICSMAIVGLLMFSGCLNTEEALGKNINPTAVVDVNSGFRVVNLNDQIQFEDIIENLRGNQFLMSTEKMSSNKVFSFGRDHGYHGRLLSHGIVAEQSLHVKDNVLTGYCFTPQDGNALLSSVAATIQYYYKNDWQKKMEVFNRYIFKNI